MGGRNKYAPLGKQLSESGLERVQLTFEEMNTLCGLPKSAYATRQFWENSWRNRTAHSWLQEGYIVGEVRWGSHVVFLYDPQQAKDPGAGRKNSNRASTHRDTSVGVNRKRSSLKTQIDLPRPCPAEVEKYLQVWNKLENYPAQEVALDELFLRHCPENKSLSDILLKVAALNTFYSTNIFSVAPVAQHILELDIDSRLAAGDLTLVEDIQRVKVGQKQKNYYSFASKYCSHHRPDVFPIYDRYVEKMLCYFRDVDGFLRFRKSELKDYIFFQRLITQFQKAYGLEKYSVKDVDKYLWQMGKNYFPNQYKKQQKN